MARDLGGVEVDPDHLERRVQPPVHLHALETRADGQRDVDLGPEAMRGRDVERELRAPVDHALAHPARDHRRAETFGDFAHERAGTLRPAADEDHRPRGAVQQRRCPLDRLRIGLGRADRGGRRRLDLEPGVLCHHVHRHLERDRARPAGRHLRERLGDQARGVLRRLDPRGPFGQPLHDPELVRDLVQEADAAADVAGRDLAGEAEHRRARAIGGRERRGRVEEARPRHHAIGARPAARRGIAIRHVARRLLVPGHDHAQAVGQVVERAEERVVLDPGQHEQRVQPLRDHGAHQRLAAGHPRHRRHRSPPAQALPRRVSAASSRLNRSGASRWGAWPTLHSTS